MKIVLIVVGVTLMAMGLVDLVGSYAGFDLWGTLGIELPEIVWRYSAYLEMIAGYLLFKAAGSLVSDSSDQAPSEA